MAVQVFRCRFLTRPPLLLCQRWAPSSRGLLVGSLPPAPGPFVCPPQRHTVSLQLRVKSRSRGALSSRPGFPSDEAPPAPGSLPCRTHFRSSSLLPTQELAGVSTGLVRNLETKLPRPATATALRLPAPGRDCLSGYLVLCKLFIRVL